MTVKSLAQSMSAMKGPGNAIPHLLLQIVLVIKVIAITQRHIVLAMLTLAHFDM